MDVSGGKMPVWMVLQIAWSGVVKTNTTLRFPTFFEERFMVYQAIINGARGLNFYGGNLEQPPCRPKIARSVGTGRSGTALLKPVISRNRHAQSARARVGRAGLQIAHQAEPGERRRVSRA